MRAIHVTEFGGPEVLEVVDLPDPEPADDQVVVDVTAAGVNYADTHQTENTYLASQQVPFVPGAEIVGRDPDGNRVAALVAGGGYAQRAVAHRQALVPVPDEVDDAGALALLVAGATAYHVLHTSAALRPGESVVVMAAAGGVGTLATQLATRYGAGRVIGVASSEDKRKLAVDLGADATVDSRAEDLSAALREANHGQRVDVVLEMVGGAVFDACLHALAPFGRLVIYGMAAREPAHDISPGHLLQRSKGVVGFWLAHCYRRPQMLTEAFTELFGLAARGELRPVVGGTYPLSEARRAHEDLLSRRTTGKLILDVTG